MDPRKAIERLSSSERFGRDSGRIDPDRYGGKASSACISGHESAGAAPRESPGGLVPEASGPTFGCSDASAGGRSGSQGTCQDGNGSESAYAAASCLRDNL